MKRIVGGGFSVRFYRRGVVKEQAGAESRREEKMATDVPQKEPETVETEIFSPARLAKEKMLRDAARTGDCYIIRMLVVEGVDLEARDAMGRTAINVATQYNQREALKTLLAAREMRRMAKLGELPDTGFFRKFRTGKTGSVE